MKTQIDIIKEKIRVYMNDIADHMASGGCANYEEYVRLCGKVDALAQLERDLLDEEKKYIEE